MSKKSYDVENGKTGFCLVTNTKMHNIGGWVTAIGLMAVSVGTLMWGATEKGHATWKDFMDKVTEVEIEEN